MTTIKTIPCEDVPALLEQSDVMILDCRDVGDYQLGHIEGAMHSHDDLVEGLIRRGNKNKTMLIYCYTGHRSEHLTEFFTGFGFSRVYNMAGGYTRWQSLQEPDNG